MRVWFAGGGTGGHLYPGLAIARAMTAADPSVSPFFVGARRGIERELLPKEGFPFELLDLHPLYRSRPWENWKTLRGMLSAWRRLRALAREERPALIVGTGGYASGLALAYGVMHRIPIALQEANSHPGLTVRIFARFARSVYLGFPEAAKWLKARPGALHDTGCPIDPPPSPRPDRGGARAKWGIPREGGRVVLIFGGSQGARGLNAVVADWIRRGVPSDVHVIWGTGRAQHAELASLASERVQIHPYLSPIADAYAAADLAITRAGAMTTAELCAWGVPMILVPLPTAAADHQSENARSLQAAGAAIHLPQRDLTGLMLEAIVNNVLGDPARLASLAAGARGRARPDAARTIADDALTIARTA
ncbi:MAG TPA: UDP-N-acetylglucosamine--N-acetylmuramyl-(pentapeptide) pyrophosphoryl-undecaprenol N-acetylglucosamine transferase [Gemmatimonadaceae bacterium]|nr:UDP-N-acetylglucosamine--N-acetylmuramyl-(pentapeptide) pyrophosphoryl-undecaprenol N-acetylglucosamine transferase [Gemmatimonadaceae bacterium]